MEKKYTKQTINKQDNFFDIRVYDESDARYMLEIDLCCKTHEEASFKAKVIFDEIKRGNVFTIVEKDGTRISYRIATEYDIKTEPIYRKAEDEFIDSALTDEDRAKIKAVEDFFNMPDDEFNEILKLMDEEDSVE